MQAPSPKTAKLSLEKQASLERLLEVAENYARLGGVSPINEQCRSLIAALRTEFDAHGLNLPIYWGNRNWHPFLEETMRRMSADGVRRAQLLEDPQGKIFINN